MKRRVVGVSVIAALIAGLIVFAFYGCAGLTTTTSTSTSVEPPAPGITYLDSQPVNLDDIANLEYADLSDAELQVLARQSFVAVSLQPQASFWKFWHIYEDARYRGLPVFVTTDSLLNAYHSLFDTLLQRAEETSLFDQAVTMTQELYNAAYDQWTAATNPVIKAEAGLNMAYFAVAAGLLEPGTPVSLELESVVQGELALIQAAEGPAESLVLGYTEDYSQYKPRGHYTRSERLQSYFKAMMWYGHPGFFINARDPDVTLEEADSLTRRAVLISSSLTGTAKEAWDAIYGPTSFLVGQADDLTVEDMQQVISQVYGTAEPSPDTLTDAALLASVRTGLNALPAPKILSAAVATSAEDDTSSTREESERSFRVLGQRFIPDSYALQQLVWAYVGTQDNMRTMPMGLDVMAVLGSDQAYELATDTYDLDDYQGWDSQLAKVQQEFDDPETGLWPSGLYTGWLESLQQVMAMPEDSAPAFMKSKVWARKNLNTALGSWTELRHDTILYAKQSVVAEGEGGEESVTVGYVEPYPDFYSKIADLGEQMKSGLDGYGLLDELSRQKLDSMISLANSLAKIAERELAGDSLTAEEVTLIQGYGQRLEALEHFGTDYEGFTLSPAAERSPIVADVHSDYTSIPPKALEEATGYPLPLYVAFERDGVVQLFMGASYSYYEFTVPVAQRLTDEDWLARLDAGTAGPRPTWTSEWIVQE